MKFWFAIPLWQRVIGALILGVVTGLIWGPEAESIKWIGDFFIASIKMLVVPLIFFSLVSGVTAIGDLRKLGAVGGRAVLLFVVTGQIAVWLGLGLGALFLPGAGLDTSAIDMGSVPEAQTQGWREMILSIVPASPVQVMADANVLPLIVFALLIGIGVLMAKEEGTPLARIFDSGAIVMQKVTIIVMELTPFGVFALIAWVAGTLGPDALVALAKLVALNYAGCLILIFGLYFALIKFFVKVPVIDFVRGMVDAMAVGYSTASSSATLPVTLRCLERNIGVSRSVSSFTASLGATINMDGTAMYLGLATLFGAQIFGVQLDFVDFVIISVTATLGSIGAAGIPGAGLIMMTLVFGSVGVPLETIAFVAGVDRIMDMMRTTTNVTSDATVATMVAKMTGALNTEELESADDV
ncbi:dicarboxylate/amino acid:cation symporter [Altericroceibacterium endophyticum]|uniref:Cation:dicarboxylase symporter family transporter n=1 Tax=Altericroceibacterium endophyticum TaxID=1808508 RepID=A0A6I4T4H9_9SPHN|nr:dicarboxylate/amino acid:cation symporter [Altericroceibacterium endophyticum]MXO65102.1 cation:dicarboxylase symporter family transporter [Altericroceibacterium endophyticum]